MRTGRCSARSTGCGWARSKARGPWASTTAIGSLEPGKEADLIAVDPRLTVPLRGLPYDAARVEPDEVMSRLIFRAHPDMVRAAWVRGRLLEGPAGPTS